MFIIAEWTGRETYNAGYSYVKNINSPLLAGSCDLLRVTDFLSANVALLNKEESLKSSKYY
jgi:hypothetical protein